MNYPNILLGSPKVIAEAARYFWIPEVNLSKNLNKGESIPGVVNLSFSRGGIAA